MITRYTRPEMQKVWSEEARFKSLLRVEIEVAAAQAQERMIPRKAYLDISKKAKFQIPRILEIEKTTKHDVIAFVSNVAENVGESGKYLHFGMTSSDVLDTATSLQILQAGVVLEKSILKLSSALKGQIKKHAKTICAGRTHGMHAEPTTFGFKLSGFLQELERNQKRVNDAIKNCGIAKLSGAVGTFSAQSPTVEAKVAKKLNLIPEKFATQVVPRDRHAELFTSLAILGGGLERLSTEIRHLQRTEVGEVREGFSKGQKGSSAMPHKRNPIGSENITGCARLLRGYAVAALENIALWHERDISHSSVERVILPDAFILADYATDRLANIIRDLEVDKERMRLNLELSYGTMYSSHVLLHLVQKGLSREEAYAIVQRLSHKLTSKSSGGLKAELLKDSETKKLINKAEINKIFSGQSHLTSILKVISQNSSRKGK